MQQLTSDVVTVCVALGQGVSSLLLAVGTQGKCLDLPHAGIRLNLEKATFGAGCFWASRGSVS